MNANSKALFQGTKVASDRKRRSGFTLIECLVVLAILAVLAALLIPISRIGGVREPLADPSARTTSSRSVWHSTTTTTSTKPSLPPTPSMPQANPCTAGER